jgi:GTP-binding protein
VGTNPNQVPLRLAIIGRPNVGKSTLFNRLAGRKTAIVHDTPGVTRDRKLVDAIFGGIPLLLIDTAGFEEGAPESLSSRMTGQTLTAIADADVCLFLIDARAGVTPGDEIIARNLHRAGRKVILAANKCEGRIEPSALADVFALGFGTPLKLSAEHALGMEELVEALKSFVVEDEKNDAPDAEEAADEDYRSKPLRLALVGRPNVGKSSLFNRLLGEERSLTGPEAGLTRDSITAPWRAGDREVLLHDTAGLRKKARVAGQELEELSVASTLDAIRFADCVIVMMDANAPFEKQDLIIADLIAREGRAIVFAINKWDALEDRGGAITGLRNTRDRLLPQVAGSPMVAVSALTGEGIERMIAAIAEADEAWNTHIPTAALNRFLEDALQRHAPPAVSGRRVRVRYMTQPKTRPPTFALFGNQLEALPQDYQRYLQNGLRAAFKLGGTPLRFLMRTSKNPYDPK